MNERKDDRIAGPTTRLKVLLVIAAAVIAAGWLALFALLTAGDVVEPPPVVVVAPPGQPAEPSAKTVPAEVPFEKLQGRWQRSDGDYALEIRQVQADGKLEAAYLNPNPIHVAKAEGARRDGKLTLFVELQDAGYPGSTYRLTYDREQDQLQGSYLQAASGETFDVVFQRQP